MGIFQHQFAGEKDPAIDPAAADLATLALDALVEQQGFFRTGPNPFLFSE
jgi:FdhE protein